MNKHVCLPVIAIAAFSLLPSCTQTKKPATGTVSVPMADALSDSAEIASDTQIEAQKNYIEGYIFVHSAMCDEGNDGNGEVWISADYFCLGNYEFPTTDYYSCLRDSGDVLYYCPGTQDQLYFRGYLTKERFAQSTIPVKAYVEAPDSWPVGKPLAFSCNATGEVRYVTKIRINDPDAVLVLDEQGKTESLYGKYVYSVADARYENIFYREILDAYTGSYDPDLTLKVNGSGYFSIVNSKTNQVTPTSSVQRYPDIPDFSYLYFIDDSTITIDQLVYHKVEEKCEVSHHCRRQASQA